MEPIKLTEKHKAKLLEMCKKLFPEYNYNKKTGYGGWTIGKNYSHSHLIGYLKNDFNDSIDDPDVYIHWFEFCMTHLTKKLDLAFCDIGDLASSLNGDTETEMFNLHPIDYLYNEFKKLK